MRFSVTGASGRMGQELQKILQEQANYVIKPNQTLISASFEGFNDLALAIKTTDVVIDFTTPESSLKFAKIAADQQKAIVIGSTGFNHEQMSELENLATKTPVLYSANMSMGINLLQKILADATKRLPDFDIEICESHHRHKVDAPSGTALMLGNTIASSLGKSLDDLADLNRQQEVRARTQGSIGFSSIRAGNIPGTHSVFFASDDEIIEFKHQAVNRKLFANGAVTAAKWLYTQPPGRLYNMLDVLG